MKIEKLRDLSKDDLVRKLSELQDMLMKTRVKVMTKQVENTALLSTTRRDIARIYTLLRGMEQPGSLAPAAGSAATAPKAQAPKVENKTKAEVKAKVKAKAEDKAKPKTKDERKKTDKSKA